jgi:hypothetical protein
MKADEVEDNDIAIINESLTPTTMLRLMKKFPAPQAKLQLVEFLPQNTIPQSPLMPGCYEDNCNSILTCSVCYCSFWYEHQTVEHMRIEHEGEECVEKLAMYAYEETVEQMVKESSVMQGDTNVDSKITYQSDDYEKLNEHEQGENKLERGENKLERDDNGNMFKQL